MSFNDISGSLVGFNLALLQELPTLVVTKRTTRNVWIRRFNEKG